ncbi:hypothetical protein SAMN04488030_2706 [Aliiroseovarius halocynthiae]|uniref:Lipoprotein n=1 Tax=Aliiroseovarius halocynthiae TaxID=985055 RepID=A0A545SP97_9RHOB|nr:hypothetical protein [Aliiroseovarius halocynthiae]TQV66810.1 hypothetical protein FIL88_11980 [Aliiroseovarius halocynthiae]SMR82356.1 hypothetical protein SAMN04488030_2706 [Aliiroseovarius halocynthiae]
MRKILFLLCLLPLSACIDAELTLKVEGDNATVASVIRMAPEAYQMAASSGENLCEDGIGEKLDDGGYICSVEETGTIDEMIAELEKVKEKSDGMAPDETAQIERLADGNIRVSMDLGALKRQVSEGGLDPAMIAMLQQSFIGRRLQMEIVGNIVETNGEKDMNGRKASLTVPLDKLLMQDPSVPDSFITVVMP